MNKKWVTLSVLLVFVLGVAATKHVFPPYWRLVPPDHSAMASTGTTADGYPWIGSSNPQLEIVEFSDYLCFQCRKMHFFLRQLIQRYPDRIRLVHRNYPMDHEFNFIVKDPAFHNGSGKLALLALYAELEGKFWQMNDELYQAVGHSTHIDIKDIASRTGIDARRLALAIQEPRLREKLRVDVWQGMKLRMTGTPSYLINGKVYQGLIPPEVLKSVLNQ